MFKYFYFKNKLVVRVCIVCFYLTQVTFKDFNSKSTLGVELFFLCQTKHIKIYPKLG